MWWIGDNATALYIIYDITVNSILSLFLGEFDWNESE